MLTCRRFPTAILAARAGGPERAEERSSGAAKVAFLARVPRCRCPARIAVPTVMPDCFRGEREHTVPIELSHRVADLSLAEFGRKEIGLAEGEMPGLMSVRAEYAAAQPLRGARITGSLSMTVPTAVL